MLMADPTVLRTLVERYETLRAQADRAEGGSTADAPGADSRVEQRIQDTAYTLCVSTGTREIGAALAAARARIEAADAGEEAGGVLDGGRFGDDAFGESLADAAAFDGSAA